MTITKEVKRCGTCASWKKRMYKHCQNSGPFGILPVIGNDKECKWIPLHFKAKPKV